MRAENGELTVIGRPSSVLGAAVHAGDRLVRSSPAEGIEYSAVILSDATESATQLTARGVPVEWAGAGRYVEVLDPGDQRGVRRSVGRRLTDAGGRMPAGQMLLRAAHGGLEPAWVHRQSAFESAEQQAPIDWCQVRQTLAATARAEELRWTGPNGVKLLENNPAQLPVLTQYWSVVPGFTAGNAAALKAQQSANDQPGGEWSAAFICFVMHAAGVRAVHGFDFSQRHMNYIVGALRNRERGQRDRPFWLVDHIELEHEATPEPGDLVCFNRCVERQNHHDPGCPPDRVWTPHSYETLRRRFWQGGNQNAPVTGSSHTSLVVGVVLQGGQRRLELIGGNEIQSVRVRTHIPIDGDGHIMNPGAHHIFGMIKLIAC